MLSKYLCCLFSCRNKSEQQKAISPTSISLPLHSLTCNKSTTSSEEISPKRIFFSPGHCERLWSTSSLLLNEYRGSFPGVHRIGHNMNHLPPHSTKAKHKLTYTPIQWCNEGGFGVFKPPPHKFRRPSKIMPNSTRFVKTVKNCWI